MYITMKSRKGIYYMEEYLIKDYNVYEDKKHLTNENQIESYFKDNGYNFFDSGVNLYQDIIKIICKIGNKFYEVFISAELESERQGENRLYWVDYINNVTYKEIEKPQPKHREQKTYVLNLTSQEQNKIESIFKDLGLKF